MPRSDDGTITAQPPADRLTLRSNKIRVEVVQGPDAGAVVELPGPEARVGSDPGCDLQLKDRKVSRLHLVLRIERDRIRVIDPGSRNGTTVDGVQVRDAYARPDSSIMIGSSALRLRMLSTIVELPLSTRDRFGGLLGSSVAMRRIFAVLERVAPTDTTLLIEGESGTGKELAARGVHEASTRAGGPFVVFDCSTASSSLLESELFGHKKGAFTGALEDRVGMFEEADGGTLFLDELGELPPDLQPKLLRVLESGEVRRVGSNKPRRVDIRVVAATNRSLPRAVELGAFREDLYYRLAVVPIRLPPLRERPEDIPLLVRHLEQQLASRIPAAAPLPEHVVNLFAEQSWPGNVRELRNAVARALALGAPEPAGSKPQSPSESGRLDVRIDEPLLVGRTRIAREYEKLYMELALKQTGGNVSQAAELAGIGRKFAYTLIHRFGLRGSVEGPSDPV
ncbi:ATPase AAA [Sorangium cellulosum]|uniref:ATPase AAA n=1 Tax=Sorangium cellulosum TaxID=56 RepID=A0A2L0EKZ7_SORCE|nr:sigma 54-dependent Fis family transcriptional regulator [Sorangium cellulosum]AUX39967.1 ATPase AAA [Sorangium cellulosum]